MRREARRAAGAARIADGALAVIEALDGADAKTKSLVARLGALRLRAEPTLLVARELGEGLARASRNVPWLAVETPPHGSVYQLLRARRRGVWRAGDQRPQCARQALSRRHAPSLSAPS